MSGHFIVIVLTAADQGVFISLERSCLLDLQFLRFTSKTEDICSLTDNENIFVIHSTKSVHIFVPSLMPNAIASSLKTALFPKYNFNIADRLCL